MNRSFIKTPFLFLILSMMPVAFAADRQQVQQGQGAQGTTAPAIHTPQDQDYVLDPFNSNWDPMADFMRLQNRLENFIDQNFSGRTRSFFKGAKSGPAIFTPAMDMTESPEEVTIKMDVPGIAKEDLGIEVQNKILTVSGVRKSETQNAQEQKGYQYRVQERNFGQFQRSIRLPDYVDENQIRAEYQNGTLIAHLVKTKQAQQQAKKVQIQ